MNKSKFFLFSAGFLGLMLAGCQAFDEQDQEIKSTNGLRVNYSSVPLKANNDTPNTRANDVLAVNGEDMVNTMRLFFFQPSDDGTGTFVESYTVPETELGGNSVGTIDITPITGSNLVMSDAYVILAVVNAPQSLYTNADADYAGMNETEFTTQMRFTVTGAGDESATPPDYVNHRPFDQSSLPMSCRIEKAAGDAPLSMTFERVMARIDVAMGDPAYVIHSASIWNAADAVTIWPTTTAVPTNVISRLYGVEPDSLGLPITGGLYTLPHYVESPAQNDAETTCVILGISTYTDTGDSDLEPDSLGDVSYYRLNITNKDMQNLRRNKAYSIRIMGVRDVGATNEKDALTEADQLLNITVNNWQLDDQGTVFQDEFGNMLAIGTSHLRIPPEGGRFNIQIYTIDVGVSNPRLRIRSSRLPTGMDINLIGNVLEVTSNASEIERTGIVEIEYGTLIGTIQITQTGLTDQYLEIDPTDLPIFEGQANLTANRITVSSSGSWTAILYNPGFSFIVGGVNQSSAIDTLRGVDHDQVYIRTHSQNDEVLARSAFCLFTLDANPDIRRTLVLTQRGVGGIDLKSNTGEIINEFNFDPFGAKTNMNFAHFNVTTDNKGTYQDWEIVKSGTNPDKFKTVSITDPTQEKTEGTYTDNSFTIVADTNRTETAYTATIRVQLKGNASVGRSFVVTQAGQTLSFNPAASAGNMSISGGTETFKVTSSTSWTATIETFNIAGAVPELQTDSAGIATLNKYSGVTGDDIILTFPKNSIPMIIPRATITVKLDNTNVVKTITVRQAQLNPRLITIRQHYRGHGTALRNTPLYAYDAHRAYEIFTDPSKFGPSGTVYTVAPLTISHPTTNPEIAPTFLATDGIYWENETYNTNYSDEGVAWKASNPKNFWMGVSSYYDNELGATLSRITGSVYGWDSTNFFSDGTTISPASAKANSEANNNRGKKLWDYLLKDGPFTNGVEINPASITFVTQGIYWGNIGLSSYPTTMIPIIMYNNHCTVGIDPTHNVAVIYPQLFNYNGTANDAIQIQGGPQDKFLCNLLAFIVNAAQYGEDFTSQFKD
jgi:hypothetical protein